jgi:signal transduction histidine kinase
VPAATETLELQALRRLLAAIAQLVGGDGDLVGVLELVAEQARSLSGAAGVAILLRTSGGLAVAARAGSAGEAAGAALEDLGDERPVLVPLVFRGRSVGLLAALGEPRASDAILRPFAASAAAAVAAASTVERGRLEVALDAAEAERARWARTLHDDTLQGLAALRLQLVNAGRQPEPERLRHAVGDVMRSLEDAIDRLRALVRELRPAALDQLGLDSAVEGLADAVSRRTGLDVRAQVTLDGARLPAPLETAIYRVVQEALANVVDHAGAAHAEVAVEGTADTVGVLISDDGHGFDPEAPTSGFGLAGMRERVALLSGRLEVASSPSGTRIGAVLPRGG